VIPVIGKKVLETEPVSITKIKEILEDLEKDYELNYEQNLTLDHARKFSKLEIEDAQKLIEELQDLVKKKYAIRIADMLPQDLADLRLLFAKERVPIKKEDLDKILKIVKNYPPK